MKRIVPILALIFTAMSAYAQLIEITPNPIQIYNDNVALNDDQAEVVSNYTVKNISTQPLSLIWVREVPEDCKESWRTLVCDNNNCYADFIGTNGVDGADNPAVLQPGQSYEEFALHVLPHGSAGCCNVKIYYYLQSDLNNPIEVVDFDIRINDPNCELTSTTSEAVVSALRVFPNPMTDFFQLEGNESNDVKQLVVYNLIGRQVRSFDATNSNNFDMSGLPQGIYLIGMVGDNGNILKTVRISRQIARP